MSHDSFDWQANRRIVQLAERVDKAWRAQFAGPSTIPLSVVAALTLIDKAAPDGPDPDQRLMSADSTEVAGCITEIWTAFCRARPDLMYRVLPLLEWTQNDTLYANERDGIAAVTEAAARSGLVDMAINGHLTHIDVLGPLVMALRPKKTRDRDGQFFTPADVARLHAELLLGDTQVEPGTSFCEPTAGAGGMLLATAEVLRQRGNDPASMTWVACDIDPVLAACTAVQAHRWGLGTNVLIGCGDALREDWIARALHERALGIRARDAASNLQILRAVQDLFTYATAA